MRDMVLLLKSMPGYYNIFFCRYTTVLLDKSKYHILFKKNRQDSLTESTISCIKRLVEIVFYKIIVSTTKIEHIIMPEVKENTLGKMKN